MIWNMFNANNMEQEVGGKPGIFEKRDISEKRRTSEKRGISENQAPRLILLSKMHIFLVKAKLW